jgi:hypothetical protein
MKTRFLPSSETTPKSDAVRQFFSQISLADRMRPVLSELLWVLLGSKSPHDKILPGYCYRIFGKFRRTYFKELPFLFLGQNARSEVGWKDLGRVIGLGLRCLRFCAADLEGILSQEPSVQVEKLTETLATIFAEMGPKSDSVTVETFKY